MLSYAQGMYFRLGWIRYIDCTLELDGHAGSTCARGRVDAAFSLIIRRGQSEKPLAAQQVQLAARVAKSLSVKLTMSVCMLWRAVVTWRMALAFCSRRRTATGCFAMCG